MPEVGFDEIAKSLEQSGWYVGREIGSGGGAKVFLCLAGSLVQSLDYFMNQCGAVVKQQESKRTCVQMFDSVYHSCLPGTHNVAAVKVPKTMTDHSESERLKREIAALQAIKHPNLIRLYDAEKREPPRWFVMEYHPNGSLQLQVDLYKGKPLQTITAVQGLAECLSLLHSHPSRYVHRDIKPKNIFVDSHGRLILGDFGIAFPNEDDGDRLTIRGTSEIFSRDWVPDWVRFRQLEEYGPKMDVHMLAKVIYFMVSGGRNVPASQLSDPYFDLTKQFPQCEDMAPLYRFLKRCITTQESACEPSDGRELLAALNDLLQEIGHKPRPQPIFNLLHTHTNNYIPIPMTGGMGLKEIASTQVFLGKGLSRFSARARVIRPVEQTKVSLRFTLGRKSSSAVGVAGADLGPEDWSHEMELAFQDPLSEGWYKLGLEADATQVGASLVAINIYGQ